MTSLQSGEGQLLLHSESPWCCFHTPGTSQVLVMLSSPLSSPSSVVTGRCPLQSARVCQLKQKGTCLTCSRAFLQFPCTFPCISLCSCALLPHPRCPDGSWRRGWMCSCLLPRMQQMDKDLPNGSGKGGIFSVLGCVCTLPVGQARQGDHKHHLLSCGAR